MNRTHIAAALYVGLAAAGCSSSGDLVSEDGPVESLGNVEQELVPVTTVRLHVFHPAGMPNAAGFRAALANELILFNPEWLPHGIQFTLDATPTVDPDLGTEGTATVRCDADTLKLAGKKYQGVVPLFSCSRSVRSGGQSRIPDNATYVASDNPGMASHELGHYFGLPHTFQEGQLFDESLIARLRGPLSGLPANARQGYWALFINQNYTNPDAITDTAPSIQLAFRADLQDPPVATIDTCVPVYTGKVNIPLTDGTTFAARFSPDRTNTMGYFTRCAAPRPVPGQLKFTSQQGAAMRDYLDAVRLQLKGPALTWSAWFSIDGTTGKPPASTRFSNRLYLFVSGNGATTDIYANSALASNPFSGWVAIGGQTDVAVGAAEFDSRLYLFTKGVGADHTIYFNSALASQPFSPTWQAVGGKTDKTIAATVFDSRLYLAAKGDGADHRILVNSALAKQPFAGWVEVNGKLTDEAPAATTFDGRLYLFAKDDGTNTYSVNSALPKQAFAGWVPIPSTLKSGVTPRGALATANFAGRLFLVARGSDNRLYINSALPQQPFGSWLEIPGDVTTDAAPTITVFDNKLYVLVKLTDKRLVGVFAAGL